jgi:hypothetical protein
MVGTMHGTHEDIEKVARCRNKQIALIDYNFVKNIRLLDAEECDRNFARIEEVVFEVIKADGNGVEDLVLTCDVNIPLSLYLIFDSDYFNKLNAVARKEVFLNLVKFINEGR